MESRTATRIGPSWALAVATLLLLLPGPGRSEREPFRISPGDLLEIRVWREPDLSGRHRVGVDGSIQHVLAGAVPAADLTPEQLAGALEERLERDYLREARVAVTLVESQRKRASVLGAVASPGAYPVAGETRVLDLLAAAGGLDSEASGHATLLRFEADAADGSPPSEEEATERLEIDLALLLTGQDLSANRLVTAGDVLVVRGSEVSSAPPVGAGRVRVVGEVGQPGSYALRDAPTLLDAVLAAGGLGEYAAANRARLVRHEEGDRQELRVRLGDLLAGSADEPNRPLRDGDLIVVPESFF